MPNVMLKLTAQRSKVACCTDWANQVPLYCRFLRVKGQYLFNGVISLMLFIFAKAVVLRHFKGNLSLFLYSVLFLEVLNYFVKLCVWNVFWIIVIIKECLFMKAESIQKGSSKTLLERVGILKGISFHSIAGSLEETALWNQLACWHFSACLLLSSYSL